MIHEAWSHFQGIRYALGPWESESEFLRTIDCVETWSMMFGKLMTFKPSHFCKTMASCCLMRPSFRSPGRALGAHRSTLSTSGFTERLRSHFGDQIWSLLHHIQQRAKISNALAYELEWNWTQSYNLLHYTMFCASETKSKMGSVESIVFILR